MTDFGSRPAASAAGGVGWYDSWRGLMSAARLSFRLQFAYRAAALAGMVTNLFFGALRIAVLLAFVGVEGNTAAAAGEFDARAAITYVALTQMFIGAFAIFGWPELMRTVHSGEIATQLLRPQPLYSAWLARDGGRALASLLMRGVPMLLLFQLLWGLNWPVGLEAWAQLACSIVLAWLVGFGYRFAVNTLAFWSPDAGGMATLAWIVSMFASGFLMPLALFPEGVQHMLALTPFPAMLNTIVDLWAGTVAGTEGWRLVGWQVFWAAITNGAAWLLLRRGLRRLEVAGG